MAHSCKKGKETILVIAIYAILALSFNWPILAHFGSSIIGNWQYNDAYLFLWNFWWIKEALWHFNNPLYTEMMYYPQQVNLTLHTLTLLPAMVSLPLQIVFKLVPVYNILYLATFILSGLGTYLLAKLLTKNSIAAFIAGVVFAFNPYIFSHALAGHFNLLNSWPIPFFVYFLYKSTEKQGFKYSIYAAIILLAQTYLDFHYLLYLIIFSLIFFIWQLVIKRDRIQTIKQIILVFLIWFTFSLPLFIPTLKFYQNQDYNYWLDNIYQPEKAAFENSDLSSYYNFSSLHPLFSQYQKEKLPNQTGGWPENNLFLGYTVIILALLGLILGKEEGRFFWLMVFLLFFSLSLGNSLQVNGKIYFEAPYGFIKNGFLPNLDLVASRFIIMGYLSLAVLSSSALKFLLEQAKNIKLKYLISLVFLGLIIFEYLPALAVDQLDSSSFLSQISQEKEDYNILITPGTARLAYLQTIHQKKTIGGYLGRRIHKYYIYDYSSLSGLNAIFFVFESTNKQLENQNQNREAVLASFHKLNIRYIMVDKKAPFAREDELIDYLENKITLPRYYEDELVKVYKIE